MYRPVLCAALCVSLAMFATGCGDDDDDNLPPPGPSLPEVTEPPFTGTLTLNGGVTTSFIATAAGTVTVLLEALEPTTTAAIGLSMGTWNGTSCQVVLFNDNTGIGSGIIGFANTPGNLCVRVYDTGKITEPVNFTVSIKHY